MHTRNVRFVDSGRKKCNVLVMSHTCWLEMSIQKYIVMDLEESHKILLQCFMG